MKDTITSCSWSNSSAESTGHMILTYLHTQKYRGQCMYVQARTHIYVCDVVEAHCYVVDIDISSHIFHIYVCMDLHMYSVVVT